MVNYTVILTEAENKAMQYAAMVPQNWIDNVVHDRARIAMDEIVTTYISYRMDNNLGIGVTTKDEMVLAAFEEGVVLTMEERDAQYLSSVGISST